jgi:carbonic anhydrase
MAQATFGTAISCIDGRVQGPITAWVKASGYVDYVDTVTVPGPDQVLTQGAPEQIAALRGSVEISVKAHGSQVVAVAGHYDCAAFSTDREAHVAAIRDAVYVVRGWGLPARVVGLWVNDRWEIEQVA